MDNSPQGNPDLQSATPLATYEHVELLRSGRAAYLVFNRPEKLNALTPFMIRDIIDAIERVRCDNRSRVLVILGRGRSFCVGDDLYPGDRSWQGPPDIQSRLKYSYVRILMELMSLRKPVLALLQGHVLGAGLDIALACDLRVAKADVQMGAPFVKRGLGGGGVYLLPKYVGLGRANEMLLLGEPIDARTARTYGLINRIVEGDNILAEAADWIQALANGATGSYGLVKTGRNRGLGEDPTRGFEWQSVANGELALLADPDEGRAAWREHREPIFTGDYL